MKLGIESRQRASRIPVPLTPPSNKTKLRGTCSRCHGEFRLQSDGNLYKHGHRGNPCLGSASTLITGSINQSQYSQSQHTNITNSQTVLAIVNENSEDMPVNSNVTTCHADELFEHPLHTQAVIKNIPKSARRACSSLLAKLVQEVTDNPKARCKWNALMSFAPKILNKPNRGGKKRNISSIINKRVVAFPTASSSGAFGPRRTRRAPRAPKNTGAPKTTHVSILWALFGPQNRGPKKKLVFIFSGPHADKKCSIVRN